MRDHTIDDDDLAPFRIDEWPYLQLADRLEDRIRRGEFGEDGKLPANDELAERYGVKDGIIRHARQELVRRNLAVLRLGQGYFARIAAPRERPETA
jgi:DNA-binding GntR family transcriptional regulator